MQLLNEPACAIDKDERTFTRTCYTKDRRRKQRMKGRERKRLETSERARKERKKNVEYETQCRSNAARVQYNVVSTRETTSANNRFTWYFSARSLGIF